MDKIKVHELAKKLGTTSKEIISKAKELGIEIKTHLSSITEDEAKKITDKFSPNNKKESKDKKNEVDSKNNKKSETPVIIRREVIIADEELEKKEAEEKAKKMEKSKKDVGFVERDRNKDFNIVYRNKPTKPMTVSELFGLSKPEKKQEEKKEEKKVEPKIEEKKTEEKIENTNNKPEIKETVKVEEEKIIEKVDEEKPIMETITKQQNVNNLKNNLKEETRSNFNSGNTDYRNNNQYKNNQNSNNFNRNNKGYNNNRPNYNNHGENNRFNNQNGQRNNNYKSFGNGENKFNNGRDNNYKNRNFNENGDFRRGGNRPLDEKGIEKNIKNIMASDVVEKESVREYNNKAAYDKQKNNAKFEENNTKNKKSSKPKKGHFDINEDKLKSLKQVDKLSNMFDDQEGGMLDYYDLTTVRGRKNKKKNVRNEAERTKQKIFKLTEVTIPETITVKDLATEMKITSSEVIKKLLGYGILATINNEIDFDTAFLIAQEFGITAIKKEVVTEEDILFDDTEDKPEDLIPRPPVVVVMGHVDHGKTSLLDAVRSTNVIEGEAGGITQHIGAYKVEINGREITFLDTPGHEAFTSMRARGAQVTDIAILVVAANDGVMPQTIEAINHAKAADVPIIVAINKIDVEGANPEKVKQELTKYDLVPEEWGGDTIFVNISAKQKTNIDTLLEMVLLVADMKELKANPNKQSKGVVIEARLDKQRGPVATMLVQRGTLDEGDTIVVGSVIGRIRAMKNDKGKKVKKAGPSTPVEIIGLTEVPEAGDTFYEVKDEKTAKHLIERRKRQAREKSINATSKVTLNDLFSQIEKGNLKQLNLIVKADVQGSVEAVKQSLEKLSNEEVSVKVIHANVGGVTETDVTLAKVSNAIIIAFNVRPEPLAKEMAIKDEVEIKQYSIIYQAIEDVEAAMKGMLDPKYEEKIVGTAQIRQTFKVSGVGTIAGCYVTNGKVSRNAGVRVIRDNVVIHEGKLASLKRFKDDVKEVAEGYECGIQIENFNDLIEEDTLEVFVMEEIKR